MRLFLDGLCSHSYLLLNEPRVPRRLQYTRDVLRSDIFHVEEQPLQGFAERLRRHASGSRQDWRHGSVPRALARLFGKYSIRCNG
jgi:hypothetical protein